MLPTAPAPEPPGDLLDVATEALNAGLIVLLCALPFQSGLLATAVHAERRRGVRAGAAVGVVGLTLVVLRFVLAPLDR